MKTNTGKIKAVSTITIINDVVKNVGKEKLMQYQSAV
jgi:ABC-type Zn uptake system ZnuABC Zn-binding protein ZnuA